MNKSRQYSIKDIKKLFANSGNQCAHPECNTRIIAEDGDTVIGDICHIAAASPNGPRYDKTMNDDQRRSYDNLILLCNKHHREIDNENNLKEYTTEELKKWKKKHLKKFKNEEIPVSDNLVESAYKKLDEILNKLHNIDNNVISIEKGVYHLIEILEDRQNKLRNFDFKAYQKSYYDSLIEDIGYFKGFGIESLYENEDLYIEPIFSGQKTRLDLISEYDRCFIIGEPGFGKTLLLKKTVIDCLNGKIKRFPIYISLNEYDYRGKDLEEFISLKLSLENINDDEIFNSIQEKILLLLDGFDEILKVGNKGKFKSELLELFKKYPKAKYLVTSRPTEDSIKNYFQIFKVNSLGSSEIIEFVNKWNRHYDENLDSNELINAFLNSKLTIPDFDYEDGKMKHFNRIMFTLTTDVPIYSKEMAKPFINFSTFYSPLILSLVCQLFLKNRRILDNYTTVFENILDLIFSKWNRNRIERKNQSYAGNDISRFELIRLCENISKSVLGNFQLSLSERDLYNLTKDYCIANNINLSNYENLYNSLVYDYGILQHSNDKIYSFFHTSIAEYFFAKSLSQLPFDEALPIRRFFLYEQKQVIKYYFEIITEDKKLEFLQKAFQTANTIISKDEGIKSLFARIYKHIDKSQLQEPANTKENILLFFYFMRVELINKFSESIGALLRSILEFLILNLLDKNILHDGNYLYSSSWNSEHFAYYIDNEYVIQVARDTTDKFRNNNERINPSDYTIHLGYQEAINLNSYLYIIERLLWLNKINTNIKATEFILFDDNSGEIILPDFYKQDFIELSQLKEYARLESDIDVKKEIYQKCLIKITKEFEYYYIIGIQCLKSTKDYHLAHNFFDSGIKYYLDNKDNCVHYFEELQNEGKIDVNLNSYLSLLYHQRAHTFFDLAITNKEVDLYDYELLEKAIEDFEYLDIEEITAGGLSYFACAKKMVGVNNDNKKLLKESLKLYKKSVKLLDKYIIGYLSIIDLEYRLGKFDEAKNVLIQLQKVTEPKDYEELPFLKAEIDKWNKIIA